MNRSICDHRAKFRRTDDAIACAGRDPRGRVEAGPEVTFREHDRCAGWKGDA
jgi:hypothetical protein